MIGILTMIGVLMVCFSLERDLTRVVVMEQNRAAFVIKNGQGQYLGVDDNNQIVWVSIENNTTRYWNESKEPLLWAEKNNCTVELVSLKLKG